MLRLCPVFDDLNMDDIRKRVFLPFFKTIKMVIVPTPKYSLTHISTLINFISENVKSKVKGKYIYNVCDKNSYSQKKVSKWFQGKEVLIFYKLLEPFYWTTYLFPNRYGYRFRCLYWKLFRTNIYKNDHVSIKKLL